MSHRILPLPLLALLVFAPAASAQTPPDFTAEFLEQFNTSMEKFIALAEAMPAERYTWSPGEGVMEVSRVYMHVAHYNYLYPSRTLGVPLPEGLDISTMEEVRPKTEALAALRASADYVRQAVSSISAEELAQRVELYGRDVPQWSVLFQLLAHMNEHLGQSIAYARMNEVVPPWSN